MSLRDILTDAATSLEEAEASPGPDGVTWTRGGRSFATLAADGSAAEFALDAAVAAAAVRTPDTVSSTRGAGWVRFSPVVLDDHGVDRAAAWFAAAYRRVSRD